MEGNKKESVFKRIENNVLLQVVFFVVSMAVIVGGYVVISNKVQWNNEQKRISELKVTEDYNILVGLDDVIGDGKNIQLSGWALRLDSVTEKVHLVFKEVDGTEEIVLKTESSERENVEEYFNPNWDFGKIGFEAVVKEKKFDTDTCYEIFVNIEYAVDGVEKSKKTASGKYLYNEELYLYNPKTFTAPKITDEEIEKVIKEGLVKAYDNKAQIWVYEYENRLYFITNPEFGSMAENQIGVPIMPRTSRVELLPEERVQYGSDHLGFYYEDEKYVSEGIVPYQIVVVDLPTKYPVTTICIGLYNNVDKVWVHNIELLMAEWSINANLNKR